ncbi:MAG TPA: putative Ig domain-containing protein [Gaiellaceae bacterium]|nr:putative Ig domain-containing protein [Gaiellaceae bacterium]
MRGAIAAFVGLAALIAAAAAPGRSTGVQHVTLIGDSVADAIHGDDNAGLIVNQGIDLDLEVAPCRRVEGEGCPIDGVRPPSAVQLIQSLGSKIGPTVVVAVGYNDLEDRYAGNMEDAIDAMTAAGVKRIFWLTLRAARHPYLSMNDDIAQAAAKHPQVTVVDWNVYSRSHPDWFQTDGLHLLRAGAEGMATLIHKSLLTAGVAAKPARITTTVLPVAHRGKAYKAKLAATAGIMPYRFMLLQRAPLGVHLEANGAVIGTPRAKPGRYAFNVRVRDSAGSLATRRLTLRIVA